MCVTGCVRNSERIGKIILLKNGHQGLPTLLNYRKIAVALPLSLLTACASTPPVGGAPGVEIATIAGMPEPTLQDYTQIGLESVIRPLDVLEVVVFGVEELSHEVQVDTTGTIDYPLIGSVPASGRTMEEFSLELEERLRSSYVLNPDVSARITERAERSVTVGGEVTRPGRYPVEGPISLMDAVALGGGLDDYAKEDEVLIFRTVGADRYIGVYNVKGISRGNYPDPQVFPNDIVMVGDSAGRRRLENILQITTAVGTPLILLERILNSN